MGDVKELLLAHVEQEQRRPAAVERGQPLAEGVGRDALVGREHADGRAHAAAEGEVVEAAAAKRVEGQVGLAVAAAGEAVGPAGAHLDGAEAGGADGGGAREEQECGRGRGISLGSRGGWRMEPGGYDFDGLERLQYPHDAHHGPQDAALAAAHHSLGRRRLWEDAAVARRGRRGHVALRCRGRVEHDELAVCAEGGCRDEGLVQEDADVGDEVARGGVVCTVEHKVVL